MGKYVIQYFSNASIGGPLGDKFLVRLRVDVHFIEVSISVNRQNRKIIIWGRSRFQVAFGK
jgi:hypothetical protein